MSVAPDLADQLQELDLSSPGATETGQGYLLSCKKHVKVPECLETLLFNIEVAYDSYP